MAKDAGIPHVCDATFATPLMTKPVELGADMTLQVRVFDLCMLDYVLRRVSLEMQWEGVGTS